MHLNHCHLSFIIFLFQFCKKKKDHKMNSGCREEMLFNELFNWCKMCMIDFGTSLHGDAIIHLATWRGLLEMFCPTLGSLKVRLICFGQLLAWRQIAFVHDQHMHWRASKSQKSGWCKTAVLLRPVSPSNAWRICFNGWMLLNDLQIQLFLWSLAEL